MSKRKQGGLINPPLVKVNRILLHLFTSMSVFCLRLPLFKKFVYLNFHHQQNKV